MQGDVHDLSEVLIGLRIIERSELPTHKQSVINRKVYLEEKVPNQELRIGAHVGQDSLARHLVCYAFRLKGGELCT